MAFNLIKMGERDRQFVMVSAGRDGAQHRKGRRLHALLGIVNEKDDIYLTEAAGHVCCDAGGRVGRVTQTLAVDQSNLWLTLNEIWKQWAANTDAIDQRS